MYFSTLSISLGSKNLSGRSSRRKTTIEEIRMMENTESTGCRRRTEKKAGMTSPSMIPVKTPQAMKRRNASRTCRT